MIWSQPSCLVSFDINFFLVFDLRNVTKESHQHKEGLQWDGELHVYGVQVEWI